jgi:hypothetical protein
MSLKSNATASSVLFKVFLLYLLAMVDYSGLLASASIFPNLMASLGLSKKMDVMVI